MSENKLQIIKDLETLLNATRAAEGISLRYGYVERQYSEPYDEHGHRYIISTTFHESDRVLNQDGDPCEVVRIAWGKQSDEYATYQSVEASSGYATIKDILNAVDKFI